MRRTFRGGVHPHDHKDLTCGRASRPLEVPTRVVLPLRQHVGAPARCVVKVGDQVAEGQVIAEAGGYVSAPVHASIAGKVTVIGKHLHPAGYECESVTLEALADAPAGQGWPPEPERLAGFTADYVEAEPDRLRSLIQAAGIVGSGGAGFPTHVKLSPPKDKPIDTLIINAAECEPYLTCDHRAMLEEPDVIAHGVRIAQRILGVRRVYVGIEANKLDAAEVMRKVFAADSQVEVVVLRVKYPQGGEKQLIQALTGREVPPPPGLPMDTGCVVQNVSTCAAIARAVMEGKPFYERLVTLSGSMVKNPGNYRVRVGSMVADVIEQAGGLLEPPRKVIMGGPMMGLSMADLEVPIVKVTSGFVFLSRKEIGSVVPSPCIRCGRCVMACPLRLQPGDIARWVELGDLDAARALHVTDCMECGTCSYICPSHRWLVQQIRLGKAKLHERKQQSV